MEYSKLISVTGLPGLQELISSKNDGAIVRSLEDKSTKFISSRIHNFSHLESIEIYTTRENVNLVELFHAMEKNSQPLPEEKDPKAVRAYFEKVYPDLDFERVYNSDMKKMVRWFSILKSNGVEIKLTEIPEEPEADIAEEIPQEEKKAPKEKEKKATKTADTVKSKAKEEPEAKTAKKSSGGTAKKEASKEKAPAKKSATKK